MPRRARLVVSIPDHSVLLEAIEDFMSGGTSKVTIGGQTIVFTRTPKYYCVMCPQGNSGGINLAIMHLDCLPLALGTYFAYRLHIFADIEGKSYHNIFPNASEAMDWYIKLDGEELLGQATAWRWVVTAQLNRPCQE